jgi:hypothetical protein
MDHLIFTRAQDLFTGKLRAECSDIRKSGDVGAWPHRQSGGIRIEIDARPVDCKYLHKNEIQSHRFMASRFVIAVKTAVYGCGTHHVYDELK